MTAEIHRARIDHPIAWRGSDFPGKDAIGYDLSAGQAAALEEILENTAGIERDDIGREHWGPPELDSASEARGDDMPSSKMRRTGSK